MEYKVDSLYATPQIGWLAIWDGSYGGFALGTEFGIQCSLSHSATLTASSSSTYNPYLSELVNTTQYQEMRKQILNQTEDALNNYPLPYWNIIKMGWLF